MRWSLVLCAATWMPSARADSGKQEETFLHGTGKVVGGVLLDFPRTMVEAAAPTPPLITAGVVAGAVRGARVAFEGLQEMNRMFDPWGIKKSQRAKRHAQPSPEPVSYVTPGFSAQ